jgi:hypothetical protein
MVPRGTVSPPGELVAGVRIIVGIATAFLAKKMEYSFNTRLVTGAFTESILKSTEPFIFILSGG